MTRSPRRAANDLTLMLNAVLGEDRFDRGPVDVESLAVEYTRRTAGSQGEYIERIVADDLDGCEGALVPGETKPRRWGIIYDRRQNRGRRAYTIAHEFGHFMLHRRLVDEDPDFDGGFRCSKEAVEHGSGKDIEKEANEFAATLLMPLDDFRRIIPANELADLERLGQAAQRYGVSLTAATLRWLSYTTTRAMLISSTEGYAHWAKPSEAALKSGRFIRTRNEMYEMPASSLAVRKVDAEEALAGVRQAAGVWFPESVIEMCMRTDRYDFELTLLHFDGKGPAYQAEPEEAGDAYTQFFARSGR
ncbi:ImmA/IrrE family metallo-endopeptidase [Rhizobium leguminosarum]|uniref:ImmA/IrrE family metallo-endopeptidase n=1 Tax=Rhizobium leguminosarum TaxID=384 RepID=UPI001441F1C5|nr:ImmA/IrrE family metallo-endopeptidase [Rhizobium leguminosarum]NKJ77832.1 ImmA/IrrE family metallo-endopeptidase [Rhizobium leguminosarum bv. viciae]